MFMFMLCLSFLQICLDQPSLFHKLSCDELESIISEDKFLQCGNENKVLKVAIDWARHKSMQANGLRVGDVVCEGW
jgi:hypothetical protein